MKDKIANVLFAFVIEINSEGQAHLSFAIQD
jgi:hypothetical protein